MKRSRPPLLDTLPHEGDEPHLLRELLKTYQVLMSGFARATGMPAARFVLMRLLASSGAEVGVTDLARRLEVNAGAVTRQVQELEREGLVCRRADPKDARRSYLSLSAKGERVFKAIHERTHELEGSLASVLGADEMRTAATVLVKLRAIVESRRGGK